MCSSGILVGSLGIPWGHVPRIDAHRTLVRVVPLISVHLRTHHLAVSPSKVKVSLVKSESGRRCRGAGNLLRYQVEMAGMPLNQRISAADPIDDFCPFAEVASQPHYPVVQPKVKNWPVFFWETV